MEYQLNKNPLIEAEPTRDKSINKTGTITVESDTNKTDGQRCIAVCVDGEPCIQCGLCSQIC